jgi:hypothetical protein
MIGTEKSDKAQPFKALIAASSIIVAVLYLAGFSYHWSYYYNFGVHHLFFGLRGSPRPPDPVPRLQAGLMHEIGHVAYSPSDRAGEQMPLSADIRTASPGAYGNKVPAEALADRG